MYQWMDTSGYRVADIQTNYDHDLSPADGYVKVTGDCLDNDVTNVPVDGYVRVLSVRQIHRNLNPAINDDTDVLINAIDDDTDVCVNTHNTQDTDVLVNAIGDDTDVLVNTQDPTVMYLAERDLQVHDSGNTSQLIPKGILKITKLTLEFFDNNYHLLLKK